MASENCTHFHFLDFWNFKVVWWCAVLCSLMLRNFRMQKCDYFHFQSSFSFMRGRWRVKFPMFPANNNNNSNSLCWFLIFFSWQLHSPFEYIFPQSGNPPPSEIIKKTTNDEEMRIFSGWVRLDAFKRKGNFIVIVCSQFSRLFSEKFSVSCWAFKNSSRSARIMRWERRKEIWPSRRLFGG